MQFSLRSARLLQPTPAKPWSDSCGRMSHAEARRCGVGPWRRPPPLRRRVGLLLRGLPYQTPWCYTDHVAESGMSAGPRVQGRCPAREKGGRHPALGLESLAHRRRSLAARRRRRRGENQKCVTPFLRPRRLIIRLSRQL